MEKVVGMATIPERENTLERVISSLHGQVDKIELSLNGFTDIPDWFVNYPKVISTLWTNDKGDANKFLNIWRYPKAYYFSCDDDIIYPPDYIDTYIKHINRFKCLVTIHGAHIPDRKIQSYYSGKIQKAHCLNKCKQVKVHIPGSGVSGFDTSQLNIDYEKFKEPNMADIFLAMQCEEQNVNRLSIKHSKGWIQGGLNEGRETIYETHKNNDSIQTKLVNSISWTSIT